MNEHGGFTDEELGYFDEEVEDDLLDNAHEHRHPCLECRLEAIEDEIVRMSQEIKELEAQIEAGRDQDRDSGSAAEGDAGSPIES